MTSYEMLAGMLGQVTESVVVESLTARTVSEGPISCRSTSRLARQLIPKPTGELGTS
jgi:hypothetical protein